MNTLDDLPVPETALLAKSNALRDRIRHAIEAAGGQISFADFMQRALYDPADGYYTSLMRDIGKQGDFTTAPEVSPLFAQCFVSQVKETGLRHVLEIGAGTGRFAYDFLQHSQQQDALPAQYFILEMSPLLRARQQALLSPWSTRVIWLNALPDSFEGVIIANEVLDALPVHRVQWREDAILEQWVAWQEDQFVWTLDTPSSAALLTEAERLREQYGLSNGYTSEINLQLPVFIQSLSRCLTRGLILLADYGYGQREYYHPQRAQGTLCCFYQHHRHDNPFPYPGLQDITAHVDFTRVIESAAESGCILAGFTSQSVFLLGAGLMTLAGEAEKNLDPVAAFTLHQAIKVLTLPTDMGERIKIMGLCKNMDILLSGFSGHDRGRDL